MKVAEAFERGLIKVGVKVLTNVDGEGIVDENEHFTGIVGHIYGKYFSIKRDDEVIGNGINNEWYGRIDNVIAFIKVGGMCRICKCDLSNNTDICDNCIKTCTPCDTCGNIDKTIIIKKGLRQCSNCYMPIKIKSRSSGKRDIQAVQKILAGA